MLQVPRTTINLQGLAGGPRANYLSVVHVCSSYDFCIFVLMCLPSFGDDAGGWCKGSLVKTAARCACQVGGKLLHGPWDVGEGPMGSLGYVPRAVTRQLLGRLTGPGVPVRWTVRYLSCLLGQFGRSFLIKLSLDDVFCITPASTNARLIC